MDRLVDIALEATTPKDAPVATLLVVNGGAPVQLIQVNGGHVRSIDALKVEQAIDSLEKK